MSSRLVTRRRALLTGLAAISGLAVTRDWSDMPPTYGNILRMGDDLTYAAFRMLPRQRLVREYTLADISSFPAHGVIDLGAANAPQIVRDYRRLLDGRFADWRLSVEGRVATPRAFSLNELKQLPSRTQITRHVCEEGWSAIAQWTGVPLRAASPDHPGLRNERARSDNPARRAGAAAPGNPAGTKELEVPAAYRGKGRIRRRRREGRNSDRVGVVHGDLRPQSRRRHCQEPRHQHLGANSRT